MMKKWAKMGKNDAKHNKKVQKMCKNETKYIKNVE